MRGIIRARVAVQRQDKSLGRPAVLQDFSQGVSKVKCRRRRFPPCGSSPSWLSGAKRGAREGQRGGFPPFSSSLPPHPRCTLLLRTGLSSRRRPHGEIYSEILTKKGKEPRAPSPCL